jgi:uncharacterized membrane-anchored protein YjiN (DUF445 family)
MLAGMTPFANLALLTGQLRHPAVRDLAWTLCSSPLLDSLDGLQPRHPLCASGWATHPEQLVDWLQADLAGADSSIRRRLIKLSLRLGEALERDAAMRRWINDQLLEVAPTLVERHREDIRRYIAERVEKWNSDELVAQLEHNVGKDLQFIRINGTLVGGLVGLLLHGLTRLVAG